MSLYPSSNYSYSTISHAKSLARIKQAGLSVSLRADQPIDHLLEIGDALLASPILVVALPTDHPEVTALVEAFTTRFGDHLLLGVSGIDTVAKGIEALAAGAQFLMTTRYRTELHQHAEQCGALYIPKAASMAALPALAATNVVAVTMEASALLMESNHFVVEIPQADFPAIIATDISDESMRDYARAGAIAADVSEVLFPTQSSSTQSPSTQAFPTQAWSMPNTIRLARQLRASWLAA